VSVDDEWDVEVRWDNPANADFDRCWFISPDSLKPYARTFTAAEVAEVVAGIVGEWRAKADTHEVNGLEADSVGFDAAAAKCFSRASMRRWCADELHERITHWLRENEG
jgi:hypothetical protein